MDEAVFRLAVSLSIGLLVGLERGWRERDAPDGGRTAGIRTYGISGLLGGILAALSGALSAPVVFAAGFLGFALVFAWFQAREARHEKTFSATGAVVGLCVFALGGLAVAGDYRIAAAGGALLAAVLASRELLHGLLKRLSWEELRSALVLAVMTTIVLPLLPDRAIDPWNGFNPREIWFFTVLTAAISYLGYIATRVIGPAKGFLVGGLAGGLVSSTAVTVAFAHVARSEKNSHHLSGAAAFSAMVSVLRVLVIVLILRAGVFAIVAPAALAAAAVFGLGGFLLLAREDSGKKMMEAPRNPFRLAPLLLFAAAFAAMSVLSAALVPRFGDTSLLATSALSGAFDVDVAVLSALRLAERLAGPAVGQAVLVGLLANAFGRLFLAMVAGPRRYWLPLAGVTALAAVAAVAVFVVTAPA